MWDLRNMGMVQQKRESSLKYQVLPESHWLGKLTFLLDAMLAVLPKQVWLCCQLYRRQGGC